MRMLLATGAEVLKKVKKIREKSLVEKPVSLTTPYRSNLTRAADFD